MHIVSQFKQRDYKITRAKRQTAAVLAAPLYIHQYACRNAQRYKHRAKLGIGEYEQYAVSILPVAAKQGHKVECFYAAVIIACGRTYKLIQKPQWLLLPFERPRYYEKHCYRAYNRGNGLCGLLCPMLPFIIYAAEICRRQQRPDHERLRLCHYRRAVNHAGEYFLLFIKQPYGQKQHQRQHLVYLPPAAAEESKQRAYGHNSRQHQRQPAPACSIPTAALRKLFCQPVHNIGRDDIRQYARHFGNERICGRSIAKPKQLCYAGRYIQHVHISRRIVRKHAGIIERCKAILIQMIAPRHEAVYISRMPIKHKRAYYAHDERKHKYCGKLRAVPLLLRFKRKLFCFNKPAVYYRPKENRCKHGQHNAAAFGKIAFRRFVLICSIIRRANRSKRKIDSMARI